jgi:hypothetical protein
MSQQEGKITPMGKVIAPAGEPIYDNYTPGAEPPKNADARGGYGNRDDKEGFGSDTATGATALGVSHAFRSNEDNPGGFSEKDKPLENEDHALTTTEYNTDPKDAYSDLEGGITRNPSKEANGENTPVI